MPATRGQADERVSRAAEHFNTQFLAKFSTVPDVSPQTVIACTARMAGLELPRDAPPRRLMDITLTTLRSAGHAVTEQEIDGAKITTDAAQLSLSETRALLDDAVTSYRESAVLGDEETAFALAVATGLFIHDCRAMLGVREGAAIALNAFAEGCRSAPQAAPLELEPVAQNPYAPPAASGVPAKPAATSLRKYMLLFAAWYIGGMVVAAFAMSALDIRGNSGLNTGVFLAAMFMVAAQFVKDRHRLWLQREKWRLIGGFLAISLAFDIPVSWLAVGAKAPLSIVLGASAFIGVLRLVVLYLFMGPMAPRLFRRYVTSG